MRDGKVHPLTFIHHTSTYQASLCKLIEYCPAISALRIFLSRIKLGAYYRKADLAIVVFLNMFNWIARQVLLALLNDEAKSLETMAFRGSPLQVSSHGLKGNLSFGHRNLHSSA